MLAKVLRTEIAAWTLIGVSCAALTGCGGGGGSADAAGTSGTAAAAGVSSSVSSSVASSATSSASSATSSAASSSAGAMNIAPTITGTPATSAVLGASYSFTPTANDANGDTLGFSITNKPSWATFNTATGALSGTPNSAGTFANVTIKVTDSKGASASLSPFTITVSAANNGAATLTWTAPTQNTDGTPLTDLSGYTIYYGTNAGSLTSTVAINSASTVTYTVTGLAVGSTYYFAITSKNSSGVESSLSSVASKTI